VRVGHNPPIDHRKAALTDSSGKIKEHLSGKLTACLTFLCKIMFAFYRFTLAFPPVKL
jgi:hypothetical protein